MASIYLRRQQWWVKFRHPVTGKIIRESLETGDEARARILRERIDHEVALLDPRFQLSPIPSRLRSELGAGVAVAATQTAPSAPMAAVLPTGLHGTPLKRARVDEAVTAYLRFISGDNAPMHIANKISILRRFLGAERIEKLGTPPRTKRKRTPDRKSFVPDPPPFFTGEYLDEVTPGVVQDFIGGLDLAQTTKRHYREFFHHFFEVALRLEIHHATNWHHPNPISALPSYAVKNREIIHLSAEDIQSELAALTSEPSVKMAVEIMIYAGLRRNEALWLGTDSIQADLSYLSVRNRVDTDNDIESSLKTGARTVTILPPLKAALQRYLGQHRNQWLLPDPEGKRWRPETFSKLLKKLNAQAKLPWSCLAFRHTYATQRAAEGWTLFDISKEMGNSAAIVEEYYAGYIKPSALTRPRQIPPDGGVVD